MSRFCVPFMSHCSNGEVQFFLSLSFTIAQVCLYVFYNTVLSLTVLHYCSVPELASLLNSLLLTPTTIPKQRGRRGRRPQPTLLKMLQNPLKKRPSLQEMQVVLISQTPTLLSSLMQELTGTLIQVPLATWLLIGIGSTPTSHMWHPLDWPTTRSSIQLELGVCALSQL